MIQITNYTLYVTLFLVIYVTLLGKYIIHKTITYTFLKNNRIKVE